VNPYSPKYCTNFAHFILALTRDSLRFYASFNDVRCAEEIRMTNTTDPWATVNENPLTLRLVWPQWQGASVEAVRTLFSEVPFEDARRGYAVGAAVLNAVLPAHTGPTALVPVEAGDRGLSKQDGIEAKEAVIAQLAGALEVIGRHSPQRILTLGGECSVSVAPFSWLAARYGDDLAVLWIDAHPDVGTPASHYPDTMLWRWQSSPVMEIRMCYAFCLPPLIHVEWLWSVCIPGPKTISPTQPVGGSDRYVLTIFTSPVSLFSIGSRRRGARVWPSISMSM
jgi:Arginase family